MPEAETPQIFSPHIFKKHPITTFYIFGSRAKGKESAASDYDFAVQLEEGVNRKDYEDVRLAIVADLCPYIDAPRVDVVVLNDSKTPRLLRYNIIKDGKILYEKDKKARVAIEHAILQDWLDGEYFERLWYRLFIKNFAQGRLL